MSRAYSQNVHARSFTTYLDPHSMVNYLIMLASLAGFRELKIVSMQSEDFSLLVQLKLQWKMCNESITIR